MKKFIMALIFIGGGWLIAFSNEREAITIATFDLTGSCISFGQNNRIEWDTKVVKDGIEASITSMGDLLNIDPNDPDSLENSDFDKSFLNYVTEENPLKPRFKKGHDSLGFSVYHILPKKHIDNDCTCKHCRRANKTSKRPMIGGSLGAGMCKNHNDSSGGGHYNMDFLFGSSWLKSDVVKIFTLGVVGFDFTKVGSYSSIEPEVGMEIDLAIRFHYARNLKTKGDVGFWIIAGIRGLVGVDFIQGLDSGDYKNPILITATVKPKISLGMSF